jgi:hypothetical protein
VSQRSVRTPGESVSALPCPAQLTNMAPRPN